MTLNEYRQSPKLRDEPQVLKTCEVLHMMATGGMDWDPAEGERLSRWLRSKLEHWSQPGVRLSSSLPGEIRNRIVYDAIVFALAQQALVEYDASRWTNPPTPVVVTNKP